MVGLGPCLGLPDLPAGTAVGIRTGIFSDAGTRKGCSYKKRLSVGIPLAGILASALLM